MLKAFLGYSAAALALLFYLRIIYSIHSGRIKPSRMTWVIWGINDFLILCTSFFVGAKNTLWVPVVYVFCGIACLALSIRNDKQPLNWIDKSCLSGSILAWILWGITSSALLALALGVAVNTLGALPTWIKTWKNPQSEEVLAWACVTASGLLQILSLEHYELALMLFPVDSFLVSASILFLSLRSRIHK